jgi:transcriptional regulator GlxA family with amidase domain
MWTGEPALPLPELIQPFNATVTAHCTWARAFRSLPSAIALGPLIRQEICYRLLTGEQGPRLRQIVSAGNHGFQFARAIDWLKHNFDKPLRIDDLASRVGLSTSAFHSHFRSTTAMSPLQFQKRMRLNEARRLMLTEQLDASRAAFTVGYESPSQFSREYSRQFDAPPMRDIKGLMQDCTG